MDSDICHPNMLHRIPDQDCNPVPRRRQDTQLPIQQFVRYVRDARLPILFDNIQAGNGQSNKKLG